MDQIEELIATERSTPTSVGTTTTEGQSMQASPGNIDANGDVTSQTENYANLSEIKWHLDRYDRLRSSTASRAGVVLSANAIIVAGASILVSNYLKSIVSSGYSAIVVMLSVGVATSLVISALSITLVVRALISNRPWRRLFNEDAAPSLFFNHGDTVRRLRNRDEFASAFLAMNYAEARDYALTELYLCIRLHRYRYESLRRAIRMLFVAILVLLSAILIALGEPLFSP